MHEVGRGVTRGRRATRSLASFTGLVKRLLPLPQSKELQVD